MNSIYSFPDAAIETPGRISRKFSSLNINSLHEACFWVKDLPYGYNSKTDDSIIIFDENKGTCSTKHGVIAELAEELHIPLYKYICFYKLDVNIVEGIEKILDAYGLKYIPQTHCILGINSIFVDLTEGNCHGKKKDITDLDLFIKILPNPDKRLIEEIYTLGLAYYQKMDPDFMNIDISKYLKIITECDKYHRNLCMIR
jgi:hypothetical protein